MVPTWGSCSRTSMGLLTRRVGSRVMQVTDELIQPQVGLGQTKGFNCGFGYVSGGDA